MRSGPGQRPAGRVLLLLQGRQGPQLSAHRAEDQGKEAERGVRPVQWTAGPLARPGIAEDEQQHATTACWTSGSQREPEPDPLDVQRHVGQVDGNLQTGRLDAHHQYYVIHQMGIYKTDPLHVHLNVHLHPGPVDVHDHLHCGALDVHLHPGLLNGHLHLCPRDVHLLAVLDSNPII